MSISAEVGTVRYSYLLASVVVICDSKCVSFQHSKPSSSAGIRSSKAFSRSALDELNIVCDQWGCGKAAVESQK